MSGQTNCVEPHRQESTIHFFDRLRERSAREFDAEFALGFRSNRPDIAAAFVAGSGHRVCPSKFRDKKPGVVRWQERASSDAAQIGRWYRGFGGCNFLAPTGFMNNLWVFDIDGPRGKSRLAELEGKYGPLPITPTVSTGRPDGGFHLWFKPTLGLRDLKSVAKAMIGGARDCIDQKGRGGYVILPGSIHASGRKYRWEPGRAPDECEMASLPPEWLEIVDWADDTVPSPNADRRGSTQVVRPHEHDNSMRIGDDGGGFNRPIFVRCCQFFALFGPDADSTKFKEVLRGVILRADCSSHAQDQIDRYASDMYLDREIANARTFILQQKEVQNRDKN